MPNGKYELGPPITIGRAAFTPTEKDTDGLSVYFEEASDAAAVAAEARNPAATLVVRIPEQVLIDLGLEVVPDETAGEPGHAIIPGLCRGVYEADKKQIKEIAEQLARLATRSIVHVPDEIQQEIRARLAGS